MCVVQRLREWAPIGTSCPVFNQTSGMANGSLTARSNPAAHRGRGRGGADPLLPNPHHWRAPPEPHGPALAGMPLGQCTAHVGGGTLVPLACANQMLKCLEDNR